MTKKIIDGIDQFDDLSNITGGDYTDNEQNNVKYLSDK
jgi:hypothetical protein